MKKLLKKAGRFEQDSSSDQQRTSNLSAQFTKQQGNKSSLQQDVENMLLGKHFKIQPKSRTMASIASVVSVNTSAIKNQIPKEEKKKPANVTANPPLFKPVQNKTQSSKTLQKGKGLPIKGTAKINKYNDISDSSKQPSPLKTKFSKELKNDIELIVEKQGSLSFAQSKDKTKFPEVNKDDYLQDIPHQITIQMQQKVRAKFKNIRIIQEIETGPLSQTKFKGVKEFPLRQKVLQTYKIKQTIYVQQVFQNQFYDVQFPPNDSILALSNKNIKIDITWKRLGQMGPSILWSHIDPNSIIGGQQVLNSTVSCLCNNQQLIVHLFQSQKYNSKGRYFVRLFIEGVWRYIYIDDYVRVNNNKVIGLQSKQLGQMWPTLLQKAIAKTLGAYQFIKNVSHLDMMVMITGCPFILVKNIISNSLQQAILKNQPVILVCKSIYAVTQVTSNNIKIRNTFSNNKNIVNIPENKLDKHRYYSIVHQLFTKKDFYSVLQLFVYVDTHLFIELVQMSRKIYNKCSTFSSSVQILLNRFFLFKQTYNQSNNQIEYKMITISVQASVKNNFKQINLDYGKYLIFSYIDWIQNHSDYHIRVSSSQPVFVHKFNTKQNPNIISQCFAQTVKIEGVKRPSKDVIEYHYVNEEARLIIMRFQNMKDQVYHLKKNFSKARVESLRLLNYLANQNYSNVRIDDQKKLVDMNNLKQKMWQNTNWEIDIQPKKSYGLCFHVPKVNRITSNAINQYGLI